MVYEWDAAKAKTNLRKHGVSFNDAATVFLDRLALTFPDPDHSGEEDREMTIGFTERRQLVWVSHCQRGSRIRIISARKANGRERRQYEEGIGEESG